MIRIYYLYMNRTGIDHIFTVKSSYCDAVQQIHIKVLEVLASSQSCCDLEMVDAYTDRQHMLRSNMLRTFGCLYQSQYVTE